MSCVRHRTLALAAAISVFACTRTVSAAGAQVSDVPAQKSESSWTFIFEPYLWLAGIDGSGSADDSPTAGIDIVGGFDSAFMMRLEMRAPNDGAALIADGLTLTLEDDEGSLRTETGADMVELGLSLPVDDRAAVEIIAGARWFELELDVEIGGAPQGHAKSGWVDPWVGVRGAVPLGEVWSARYRADVGGFGVGSEFTWQAALGAAADLGDHFRLQFGYRALSLDFDDDDLEYDALIHGPTLDFAFEF